MTDEQFHIEKAHRETLRWLMLRSLNSISPQSMTDAILLQIVEAAVDRVTPLEIKHELHYLEDRGLVATERGGPYWHVNITADGSDVADYTAGCPRGIARPPKEWELG